MAEDDRSGLPDIPPRLDTGRHDLAADLFVPALKWATRYRRAVGFFASGWLRANAAGMAEFAGRGGRAQWVTSPILSAEDVGAMGGDPADEAVLTASLRRSVDAIKEELEERTRSALAWMVADGIIEFRFAVPIGRLDGGDFHDKFGILEDDDGNQLSFNGSVNDSVQGLRNYESVKVFCGWKGGQEWIRDDVERFERIWDDAEQDLRVFTMPEAVREEIFRLRTLERPYSAPKGGGATPVLPVGPHVPHGLDLRDYQRAALDAWVLNGRRGLLAMATGTGKTITALAAATQTYQEKRRLAVVIAVPFTHLAEQWAAQLEAWGWEPVSCYGNRSAWEHVAHTHASNFRLGLRDHVCLLAVYKTFGTDHFDAVVQRLGRGTLLIADEAHYLGASHLRTRMPASAEFRLGLSATPIRAFDDIGSKAILSYFHGIVYELGLTEAIRLGRLTPYHYRPQVVDLDEDEICEYRELSIRIARAWHAAGGEEDDGLAALLRRRARLITGAKGKYAAFYELLERDPFDRHALVYVDPGQLDAVVAGLADLGLVVHRFTHTVDKRDRGRLLERFESGEVQALVAMKCLDEGVDVPPTRRAYILASSSNPREFIQRRGRVLRRWPGKKAATVYDFMVIPSPAAAGISGSELSAEKAILRRELARFNEFADAALNTFEARSAILPRLEEYGLSTTRATQPGLNRQKGDPDEAP